LQGIKVKEAANKRFLLSHSSLWFKEIGVALKGAFPEYKIKTGELGLCPVKLASLFDAGAKKIIPLWNK
jgi:hypothetical protein